MKTWKYNALSQKGVAHFIMPLFAFVVLFGAVGSYFVLVSHAATPATASTTGELASWLENSSGQVMCLDDFSDSSASDTPVVINPCSTTKDAQQWAPYSDGTIRIHGKCLTVQNDDTANGSAIVIADCKASVQQKWSVGTTPKVSLNDLVSKASGKCLDVYDSTANNSNTVLWSCNGTQAQVWGWNTNGKIVQGGKTADANCNYIGGTDEGGECYVWVGAFQNNNDNFSATGVSANFNQWDPVVQGGNDHSQTEFYVGTSANNAIEYGWGVSLPGSSPTLNIGLWANGNALDADSNFVQVSSTVKIGQVTTTGATANYKIELQGNDWWLYYNSTAVGYFPETIWTSRNTSMTQLDYVAVFGEAMQPGYGPAEVQMGNGKLGSQSGAASVTDYALYNTSTPAKLDMYEPNAKYYAYGNVKATSFTYGGSGIY